MHRPARIPRQLTAAAIAVLAAGLVAACSAPASSPGSTAPVEVLATSVNCATPPGEAGAAVLDTGADGARRVRLGMGRRSTGGFSVTVDDRRPIEVDDGVAVIRVDWRVPAPGDALTQALTRPCVEVAVPGDYTGVRFIDQQDTVRGHADWPD